MVSRILISIALLCSSVAMSQEESALKFNQVLIVDITNEVLVPEGKVWKVVHMLIDDNPNSVSIKINSVIRYIRQDHNPIWLPQGTTIKNNSYDYVELNIIEFNTN